MPIHPVHQLVWPDRNYITAQEWRPHRPFG
jgi:hypothetical protein